MDVFRANKDPLNSSSEFVHSDTDTKVRTAVAILSALDQQTRLRKLHERYEMYKHREDSDTWKKIARRCGMDVSAMLNLQTDEDGNTATALNIQSLDISVTPKKPKWTIFRELEPDEAERHEAKIAAVRAAQDEALRASEARITARLQGRNSNLGPAVPDAGYRAAVDQLLAGSEQDKMREIVRKSTEERDKFKRQELELIRRQQQEQLAAGEVLSPQGREFQEMRRKQLEDEDTRFNEMKNYFEYQVQVEMKEQRKGDSAGEAKVFEQAQAQLLGKLAGAKQPQPPLQTRQD